MGKTPRPRWLILLIFILPRMCLAAASPAAPAAGAVNLLFFGDWGEDTPGQKKVAQAMAGYVQQLPARPAAAISVGDNFYMKLEGIGDARWSTVFENMYNGKALPMPFDMAMGNHDYDGDNAAIEAGYAKAHPQSRWKLPSRWYRLDFPSDKPIVTVLILDSNKPSMGREDWKKQIVWLQEQLSAPRSSQWTIVVAHHPLFSDGLHTDIDILQEDWGEILKKGNVDFYICGHDHSLQHLQIDGWPMTFLITGGGGASLSRMIRDDRGPFSRAVFGFVDFEATPQKATVRFISADGKVLHWFEKTPGGKVRVVQTTGHDKPLNAMWRTAAEVREKAVGLKWMIPTTQGTNVWGGD